MQQTQNSQTQSEVKTTKSTFSRPKPNNQHWIIGGLALAMVFSVGVAGAYTLNQKTSKSKASFCQVNESKTACINPKPGQKKQLIKKPEIKKNMKPIVAPNETNPYTENETENKK